MIPHAGCIMNIAFADVFTKTFIEAEDHKSLSKASKFLNDDINSNAMTRSSINRRLVDPDYKDLVYIKWAKSAVNIHNNNVGREVSLIIYYKVKMT